MVSAGIIFQKSVQICLGTDIFSIADLIADILRQIIISNICIFIYSFTITGIYNQESAFLYQIISFFFICIRRNCLRLSFYFRFFLCMFSCLLETELLGKCQDQHCQNCCREKTNTILIHNKDNSFLV